MKHYFLFFVLLSISFCAIAQKPFISFKNSLKEGNNNVRDSYIINNKETGNFAIFIDDNNSINAYLYSKDGDFLSSFSSAGLNPWYDEIIGYTTSGNEYRLYLKSKSNRRFGSILFNFDKRKSIESVLPFRLNKDLFVQTQSVEDEFYIITSRKGKSILNLYNFKHEGSFNKKELILPKKQFKTFNGYKASLHELLAVASEKPNKLDVFKVDRLSPNSIEVASGFSKVYTNDNNFILTSDFLRDKTIMVEINLKEATLKLLEIEKPSLKNQNNEYVGNSFIYDKLIFLISASKKEMHIEVREKETQKLVKEWSIEKDDEITFNNTPIIQKGGTLNKKREKTINDTNDFLRKISAQNVGVSVYKEDNNFKLTIGGTVEPTGLKNLTLLTSIVAGPFVGVGIGAVSISFNPTYFAYNLYSNTKSTRFTTLLNPSFNHIEGDIPDNKFDKIRSFSENLESKKGESIFRFDDVLLYSYYNKELDVFSVFKF